MPYAVAQELPGIRNNNAKAERIETMRLWKRLSVGFLVLTLATAMFTPGGVAAADDPATVLQRFTAARNRGDIAGAIALLADDIRFVEGPCMADRPCVGAAAVREVLQGAVPLHIQLTAVGVPQVSGTTARQRFEVRGDFFGTTGITRIIANATVEVRDGKIASYIAVADESDGPTAQFLAYQRAAQGPPTAPPRTGGGGEASFIRRLGDG